MPAELFGLQPVADGWTRFTVEPRLGALHWACATVPTPHGDIEISADAAHVTLHVPAGSTALWRDRAFAGHSNSRADNRGRSVRLIRPAACSRSAARPRLGHALHRLGLR